MPLAQIHDGTLHHLHTDHLGTPLEASNDAGRITWRVTYRTWGNVLVQEEEEITQNLRFQGQYFDQETGLHYNRFRYYDPGPGRFVSQDPIGFEGDVNLYSYTKNPVLFLDPYGLQPKPPSSVALPDGAGASSADIARSKIGGGSRQGQQACREKLLNQSNGVYKCWRCGQTSTNPSDMHLGHASRT